MSDDTNTDGEWTADDGDDGRFGRFDDADDGWQQRLYDGAASFSAGIASIPVMAARMSITTTAGVVRGITNVLPRGYNVWGATAKAGLKGMHKNAGGDALGVIKRPNGIDIEPIKWRPIADDDFGGRWITKTTDEKFHPGVEGREVVYFDTVPLVFFDEDNPEAVSFIESRIAEAVDMGQTDSVYANPTIEHVELIVDGDGSGGGAIADGGIAQGDVRERRTEIRDLGSLEDVEIDLRGEDSDGMRVSWAKVKELKPEKTSTEEMQRQEQRGRIAESDPEAQREKWMKIIFYFTIVVVALTIGPELVAAIFGGGGGGGSGVGDTLGGAVPSFYLSFGGWLL